MCKFKHKMICSLDPEFTAWLKTSSVQLLLAPNCILLIGLLTYTGIFIYAVADHAFRASLKPVL